MVDLRNKTTPLPDTEVPDEQITPPSRDLMERLYARFASPNLTINPGVNGAVDSLVSLARFGGQQEVLNFLQSLINAQENR